MKLFTYLRYFIFLASRWDLKFAWKNIKDEIRGENYYGINSTGISQLNHLRKKGIDITHATNYMPAPYRLLEPVFSYLQPLRLTHLLDVGSGKGRVLCVAALSGFKDVTGLELSAKFCKEAEKNLIQFNKRCNFNWRLINNDAFYFEIPDKTDCICIFNPFDEFILEGVINNISISLENHPRELYIIYITPFYREMFFNCGFDVYATFHPEEFLEAIILKKKMAEHAPSHKVSV